MKSILWEHVCDGGLETLGHVLPEVDSLLCQIHWEDNLTSDFCPFREATALRMRCGHRDIKVHIGCELKVTTPAGTLDNAEWTTKRLTWDGTRLWDWDLLPVRTFISEPKKRRKNGYSFRDYAAFFSFSFFLIVIICLFLCIYLLFDMFISVLPHRDDVSICQKLLKWIVVSCCRAHVLITFPAQLSVTCLLDGELIRVCAWYFPSLPSISTTFCFDHFFIALSLWFMWVASLRCCLTQHKSCVKYFPDATLCTYDTCKTVVFLVVAEYFLQLYREVWKVAGLLVSVLLLCTCSSRFVSFIQIIICFQNKNIPDYVASQNFYIPASMFYQYLYQGKTL